MLVTGLMSGADTSSRFIPAACFIPATPGREEMSKTHDELEQDFQELVEVSRKMADANNAPGSRFTSVEQYDAHRDLCAVLAKVAGVQVKPFVARGS